MSTALPVTGWPSAPADVLAQVIRAVTAPRWHRGRSMARAVPEGDGTDPSPGGCGDAQGRGPAVSAGDGPDASGR